ncbi:hypothetical protein DFA_09694 [Cavenderia fasciculata]|uniref:Peptidase S53 domain-containing protein n=1 Tax=Cavenderia fasciculata TaxID=261658 RepID=F4Q8C2_CACFS|nr:uncharacterized protein DFA_09694 [Cavenderia fasciculata]EGG16022.1 hypothetical protein DFA_09694 [Cavenderia fasciculata]|eukprot:XP_004352347.1 hypothetical protein DFA_09694 [Cavenderia fasciculata]
MSIIKSRLFTAQVYHSRLHPVKHTFQYDVYYFVLDLDELQSGKLNSSLFGYNLYRPVSVFDKDYMGGMNETNSKTTTTTTNIKSRVLKAYRNHLEREQQQQQDNNNNIINVDEKIESIKRIEMVTMPRYMNVSFNPVNFYYCYDDLETVVQIVVEINNTFGETHLYFPQPSIFHQQNQLSSSTSSSTSSTSEKQLKYVFKNAVDGNPYLKYYSQQKDFHVSPFNSLDGAYDFCFSDIQQCFDIRINLLSNLKSTNLIVNNNQPQPQPLSNNPDNKEKEQVDYVMMTRLWSSKKPFIGMPLTMFNISKVIVGYPITAFLTIPRIMYQAGKLHWQRGLKVYAKPNPPAINTTIIIPPSSFQLSCRKFTLDFLQSFNKGHFNITLPDKQLIAINNNNDTDNTDTISNENDPTPINLLSDINKSIEIIVHNDEFFSKIYLYHYNNVQGDRYSSGISAKALGLAYVAGDFTCSDLSAFISLVCDLTTSLNQSPVSGNNCDNKWGWLSSLLSTAYNNNNILKYFLAPSTPYHCGLLKEETIQELNVDTLLDDYHFNHYDLILKKLFSNLQDMTSGVQKRVLVIEDHSLELTDFIKKGIEKEKKNIQVVTLTINNNNQSSKEEDGGDEEEDVFNNLNNLIQQEEENGRNEHDNDQNNLFDAIIAIESNRVLDSGLFTDGGDIYKLLANDGIVILQSVSGPYHPYKASDLKPGRFESLGYSQRFARKRLDFESKYWSLIANFQNDPFKLEQRYVYLMNLLAKGYINGHIYDSHHQAISSPSSSPSCNIISELVQLVSENDSTLELVEMDNIGDNYPVVIETWLKRLTEQHDQLVKDYQAFAMSQGCDLKLNESDIGEVYNSLYFHLSYLISCFKSVWSVTQAPRKRHIVALRCDHVSLISAESSRLFKVASVSTTKPYHFVQSGKSPLNEIISFKILLKQNNLEKLESIFWKVSDPDDLEYYRKYLNEQEIDELVATSDELVDEVVKYLVGFGNVKKSEFSVHADYIQLQVPIHKAEKIFHTEFYRYVSLMSGKSRSRIQGTAQLPIHLYDAIDFVVGISDFIEDTNMSTAINRLHTRLDKVVKNTRKNSLKTKSLVQSVVPPTVAVVKGAAEPTIATPQLIKQFYNVPLDRVANNSQNTQAIAAFEEFYSEGALLAFAEYFNLSTDYIRVKPLSDSCFGDGCGQSEANLDVQYITAIGTNVPTYFLGVGAGQWVLDWAIAIGQANPLPLVSSISYDYNELEQCLVTDACSTLGYDNVQYINRTNVEFMKLGLRGMSILVASGDDGSQGIYGIQGNCPIDPLYYCPLGGCTKLGTWCPSITIAPENTSSSIGQCFFPQGTYSSACQEIIATQEGVDAINTYLTNTISTACQAVLEQDSYGYYHLSTRCPCSAFLPVSNFGYVVSGYQYSPSNGALFSPYYPASSPYITSVGGTIILDPRVNREVVQSVARNSIITSGGGFSNYQAQPSYQAKAVKKYLTKNCPFKSLPPKYSYNASNRAYPDITLTGNNYVVAYSESGNDTCPCGFGYVDGTSASAPTLSGMISLVNDRLLNAGKKQLGFLNPLLYKAADTTTCKFKVFNDVTSGTTKCNRAYCCKYGYSATKGYDLASGLGSINYIEFENYVLSL